MRVYTLVGVDGNAFSIMGYTARAMRNAKFTHEEIEQMQKEATSGDYYNLIAVCDGYIDAVNERLGLDEYDEDEYDEDF